MKYTLFTPRLVEDKQSNQMKRDGYMVISTGNDLANVKDYNVNVRYCKYIKLPFDVEDTYSLWKYDGFYSYGWEKLWWLFNYEVYVERSYSLNYKPYHIKFGKTKYRLSCMIHIGPYSYSYSLERKHKPVQVCKCH